MVAVPRCPCWPPRTLMHTRREEAMAGLTLVASTPCQPRDSKPFDPPTGWGAPGELDRGQLPQDCALYGTQLRNGYHQCHFAMQH